MRSSLNTSMIGIEAPLLKQIEMARAHGFQAVDLPVTADFDPIVVRESLSRTGLVPGCARSLLPGRTAEPDAVWEAALQALPGKLDQATAAGFSRTTIVMLPFHDQWPFDACFDLHVRRLRDLAPHLESRGFRLGIEYVSPITRRAGCRHEFLHDLAGLMTLLGAVSSPAIGLLMDCFHWHCARECPGDIEALDAKSVVAVHINDTVAGRGIDEQVAMERELPLATGGIDLGGFLGALRRIGYDGPVTAEPMNPALNALPDAVKLEAVGRSVRAALDQAPPVATRPRSAPR
ncbi:MAG: sugar phosphate isomerase/epimerase family protein [Kiritimatiellia bacterium]|nr:sugar phosphate isomerase/epimerase family protein [Kiritimatiellia bacterium]